MTAVNLGASTISPPSTFRPRAGTQTLGTRPGVTGGTSISNVLPPAPGVVISGCGGGVPCGTTSVGTSTTATSSGAASTCAICDAVSQYWWVVLAVIVLVLLIAITAG